MPNTLLLASSSTHVCSDDMMINAAPTLPRGRIRPHVLAKLHMPLLYYLVFLSALIVLLILDVDFKARGFSPSDSNAFHTATFGTLREAPMIPIDIAQSIAETSLSSWPHMRSTCDNLTAFDSGGGFVVVALGSNCTLGQGADRTTTPNIVVSSTVRLDSIVWTCCKLLFPSQQPSICQDHIATDFLMRYMLPDIAVSIGDLAEAGTAEEMELQVLLDMVSRSYPLHKVVCVEGFVWPNRTLGAFDTTIYGCASPNSFRSEFIGLSNPKVRDLLRQRVWLSGDQFELLGLTFGIRQNSRGAFSVQATATGELVATLHIDTNFSCFGPLYLVMLTMDIVVLVIYLRAGYNSIKWVLGPQCKKIVAKQSQCRRVISGHAGTIIPVGTNGRTMSASASSSSIRPTEIIARKISRVRTASSSLQAPGQIGPMSIDALLSPRDNVLEGIVYCSLFNNSVLVALVVCSQLISWTFVLPNIVIWSWSLVYSAKIRAGITTFRAVVLTMMSCDLLWAGMTKLNEELAYFVAARTFVSPLEIMAIGACVAKWKYLDVMGIADRKWSDERQRVFDYIGFPGYVLNANMFDGSLDFRHGTPYRVFVVVYQPLFEMIAFTVLFAAAYIGLKGVALYLYCTWRTPVYPYDPESTELHGQEHGEYRRLPIESLLDYPIRARCLLRNNFSMEILAFDHRIIRPSCYLDSGILPRDGNPG